MTADHQRDQLVDFTGLPQRLRGLLAVLGALAVLGCIVDGVLNGLTFALMGRWFGLFLIAAVLVIAVATALHAMSAADRAQRRGQRLSSPDVGLTPRRLREEPSSDTPRRADGAERAEQVEQAWEAGAADAAGGGADDSDR